MPDVRGAGHPARLTGGGARPARRSLTASGHGVPQPDRCAPGSPTWTACSSTRSEAIPGAAEFVERLRDRGRPFLLLTNNSIFTARDLQARLARSGIDVPEESIWTCALATAQFLDDQRPGGTAYVIGEAGLTTAMHAIGYVLTDRDPDYVVLGETRTYSFEAITKAIRLIERRRPLHRHQPRPHRPVAEGPLPATGSVAALITQATGVKPYFVGKPNPLMMRSALNPIDAHSESTAMIGDRMDTDVVSGLEAGLRTFLVLTGFAPGRGGRPVPLPALAHPATRSPTWSTWSMPGTATTRPSSTSRSSDR